MAKRFTRQEIEILSSNPNVKHARENRLTLTYEFRIVLWNEWSANGSIKGVLIENGFDLEILGRIFINHISEKFKRDGKPSRGTNQTLGVNSIDFKNTKEEIDYLLSSGLFIKGKSGISFHPNFMNELYHKYPAQSIEDGLAAHNIDPKIVGYRRIYILKRLFDGDASVKERQVFTEDTITTFRNHPYIKRITAKQLVLQKTFYDEAVLFKDLHIDHILDIFEIDHRILNVQAKNRILYQLRHWVATGQEELKIEDTAFLCHIEHNKQKMLERIISDNFDNCRACVPHLSKRKRKELCQLIRQFPKDCEHEYTIRSILDKIGISKTSYYAILRDEDYGKREQNKDEQDNKEMALVRKVYEYKGYSKGSRMITMMMEKITDIRFSRGKVIRLMKKAGIKCEIRKANNNKRASKEMLERNVKDNELKRKFRLARPGRNILTDVTYIKYGVGQTAYLSCLKDASSGEVLGQVVSDRNDSQLVADTLEELKHNSALLHDSLLHSDQGVLYLSGDFQQKVKAMGVRQSMSRRGNCWDNASQESYFGHFKDECDYSDCTSLEEVRGMITDYMNYYNQERPQWTRSKMTPKEFSTYLNEMNDEEYSAYLKKEQERYERMMASAAENAKKRASSLGVTV